MENTNALSNLFLERSNFLVIGLTGRTGSGCSTAASILTSESQNFPSLSELKYKGEDFYSGLDGRRYEILRKYIHVNWKAFFTIKISDVISTYLILLDIDRLSWFVFENLKPKGESLESIKAKLLGGVCSKKYVEKIRCKRPFFLNEVSESAVGKHEIQRVLNGIKKFTAEFKAELDEIQPGLYVETYQSAGNSLRKLGVVDPCYKNKPFEPNRVFELPEAINRIVKSVRREYGQAFVVIDAIRNPYEARFFKDRYSAFYLMSVNAPAEDREEYLRRVRKFSVDQIKNIDEIESGNSKIANYDFIGQDVKKCIEISDIHLFNPRNERDNNNILKAQLAWYVALMIHPGLVSPTSMERVMQVAYTAKTNSGCISRQVGAVVTDNKNSIKAVGWNDVPEGQVPCALRNIHGVLNSFDNNVYSNYELNNREFRQQVLMVKESFEGGDVKGRNLSYCFKDIKNSVDGKGNQVHTRSLHAEENAFLQISKYGGVGVKGGALFTTASPCELCAKKAFQLGVEKIVYIDPYPGITTEHILANGIDRPLLVQFRGAVGKGYFQLYEQALPYKDELAYFDEGIFKKIKKEKGIELALNLLADEGLLTVDQIEGIRSVKG